MEITLSNTFSTLYIRQQIFYEICKNLCHKNFGQYGMLSIDLYYSVKLYYTGASLLPTNCQRITDPGFFHQTILLTSSISAGLLYLRVITNASCTQLAPTM